MNFLVVDDDRDLNDSLARFIRSKGHGAASLTDAREVGGWVKNRPCDAVILDLGMPKIDGLSLIHIIREHRPALPIIIFTGFGDDKDLVEATSYAGANGYVSKSQGMDGIYSAVIRELGKAKETPQKPVPIPAVPSAPAVAANDKSASTIYEDVEITGTVKFKGEMIFGGKLKKGSVTGDFLRVEKEASIKGNITADVVRLSGKVAGNVTAMKSCALVASAELIGDLTAERLSMEEGATLVGQVRLGPQSGNGSQSSQR